MKKFKLLPLLIIPFLSACDLIGLISSKTNEPNTQHGETGGDQPEPPLYEIWNTKTVDDLVKEGLGIDTTYSVPAYDKCIGIEYDGSTALLEGYFGIYIQTEFEECEMLYSEILEANNWLLKEKMGGFSVAFSPDYALMVEYIYEVETRELVIYITEGALVDWPTEMVANAVKSVEEDTTAIIPEFEAEMYQVTYYDWLGVTAINGFGPAEGVVADYRVLLETNDWNTYQKDDDTYGAISPDQKIRIDFYYDEDRDEFNIDIFSFIIPVDDWPSEQINEVLEEAGFIGTVLPYTGENSGFEVNYDWQIPAIYVHVSTKETNQLAEEYNQYLLDSGLQLYGYLYSDPIYYLPGSNFGYRAASLDDYIVTIELIDLTIGTIEKA